MSLLIREPPPTRVGVEVITPAGRQTVWADDRPGGHNNPSGLRFGNGMPGGYEELGCSLPRKPGADYGDMVRLSNVRAFLAGDETVWDGRLEETPRSSGDQVVIEPKAAGHQAHLGDDKGFQQIYIDKDLSGFGPMSQGRRETHLTNGAVVVDPRTTVDETNGLPGVVQEIDGNSIGTLAFQSEALYDAGAGLKVANVDYEVVWASNGGAGGFDATWIARMSASPDDIGSSSISGTDHITGAGNSNASDTFTPSTPQRFITLKFDRAGAGWDGGLFWATWRKLGVNGDHGLTEHDSWPASGYYVSDMLRHAIGKGAPQLLTTDESVPPTSFTVQQAAFKERGPVGNAVTALVRFEERDWFVYDDKLFCFLPRGSYGRKWIARASEANLKATGQSTARLWNGIYVKFRDVAGTERVAGPTGSGADVTSDYLIDADPENEANQAGIKRHDMLDMGGVSFDGGAIEVGRRFLAGARALDRSGQAQHVGIVQDDKGVWHSVAKMRSGDEVAYVDSSDPSYRRIVRVNYEHDSRTAAIDLDAPPESLDALLERLQVVLIPLGLG